MRQTLEVFALCWLAVVTALCSYTFWIAVEVPAQARQTEAASRESRHDPCCLKANACKAKACECGCKP